MELQPLFQLVYMSSAVHELSKEQLLKLLEVARVENARREISGMLLYYQGSLIQAIEGPKENVLALFERIKRDPRHSGIFIMFQSEIPERHFPEWSMGFTECDADNLPDGFYDAFRPREGEFDMLTEIEGQAAKLLKSFRHNCRGE